jgi:hypothetical protein
MVRSRARQAKDIDFALKDLQQGDTFAGHIPAAAASRARVSFTDSCAHTTKWQAAHGAQLQAHQFACSHCCKLPPRNGRPRNGQTGSEGPSEEAQQLQDEWGEMSKQEQRQPVTRGIQGIEYEDGDIRKGIEVRERRRERQRERPRFTCFARSQSLSVKL